MVNDLFSKKYRPQFQEFLQLTKQATFDTAESTSTENNRVRKIFERMDLQLYCLLKTTKISWLDKFLIVRAHRGLGWFYIFKKLNGIIAKYQQKTWQF